MTSGALSLVTTRLATPADAALLASLAQSTFVDTFAAGNTPENMALYLSASFGEAVQRAELMDPLNTLFFADRAGEALGYAALRHGPAPACVTGSHPIEIARLYAAQRFIGAGIGATLMQRCLDEAAARGNDTIWLGVWERNPRAIAFYRRWGFVERGTQSFMLGRDRQADLVMSRSVAEVR